MGTPVCSRAEPGPANETRHGSGGNSGMMASDPLAGVFDDGGLMVF